MQSCDRKKVRVSPIDHWEANAVVTEHHYLHRPVYIGRNASYGVTYEGFPGIGVIMFGFPVFHERIGLVGPGQPLANGELVDMVRVWMPDDFPPKTESCAIGKAIWQLRRDWPEITARPWKQPKPGRPEPKAANPKAIISFADEEFQHTGVIYRASNFVLLGYIQGRKAAPGFGQGRWANAKKAGVGQRPGRKKYVYLLVLDSAVKLDILALQASYDQDDFSRRYGPKPPSLSLYTLNEDED